MMSARAVATAHIQGPNRQSWRAFRPFADILSTFCAWSVCLLSFVAGWRGARAEPLTLADAERGCGIGVWVAAQHRVIARGIFITLERVIGAMQPARVTLTGRRAPLPRAQFSLRTDAQPSLRARPARFDPRLLAPPHSPSRAYLHSVSLGPHAPVQLSCGSDEHSARDSRLRLLSQATSSRH